MKPAILRNMILRMILGAVLAASLVGLAGDWAARASLPMLSWTVTQLLPDYRVVDLSVSETGIQSNTDRYFKLSAAPMHSVFVGDQLIPSNPNGRADLRILIAFLWQPFTICLPLVLAWPATGRREWSIRIGSMCGILALFAFVDVPMLFCASIWEFYITMFAPGQFSPLLVWGRFLEGGGQLVLGIVAAFVSIAISRDRTVDHQTE